jgi:hypothetical protein
MNTIFKNYILLFVAYVICAISFTSCKSKAALVTVPKTENKISKSKVLENYYNNKIAFSTLQIKANVQVETEKLNQTVTAEIKIKKDEQILVSIRFLGITMGKISIMPTSVKYYEKLNSTYYEGDFSALSQKLGTDLNFEKLQNLLLGRVMDDLKLGKYTESFADQVYKLEHESIDQNTKKSYYINGENFTLNKQEISQVKEERMIQVSYENKKEFKEMILPTAVIINSFQKNSKANIKLEYNSVNFNEELSFPFSIPNDYKRIIIN